MKLKAKQISGLDTLNYISKTGGTLSGDLYVTGKTLTNQLQVTGGTLSSGYVLTSDGSGNATWQAPTGGGGGGGTFTGGTVTGSTNFTGGLTANTISATTISGGTFYGDGSGLTNVQAQPTPSTNLFNYYNFI
jgi:nucleoid-associated protein YgaU